MEEAFVYKAVRVHQTYHALLDHWVDCSKHSRVRVRKSSFYGELLHFLCGQYMTVFEWSQTKGEGGIKTLGLLYECIDVSAHVFADEVNTRLPIWDHPKPGSGQMGNATREIERAVDNTTTYLHAVACDLVVEDRVL